MIKFFADKNKVEERKQKQRKATVFEGLACGAWLSAAVISQYLLNKETGSDIFDPTYWVSVSEDTKLYIKMSTDQIINASFLTLEVGTAFLLPYKRYKRRKKELIKNSTTVTTIHDNQIEQTYWYKTLQHEVYPRYEGQFFRELDNNSLELTITKLKAEYDNSPNVVELKRIVIPYCSDTAEVINNLQGVYSNILKEE